MGFFLLVANSEFGRLMYWLTFKSQPRSQPKTKMNATISIICYKYKTLANGEHPLMLRISKDGKRTMKSLGISIRAKDWDFKKNQPKTTCPNKEIIQQIILNVQSEYHRKVLKKSLDKEEFTAVSLVNEQAPQIKAQTVEEFYKNLIADLKAKGKIGNSYAYLNSYNNLKGFNQGKKLTYTFSHIDLKFLRAFEEWMQKKRNKETTMSFQFRTLRAVIKRAIESNVIDPDKNPFQTFKVNKFNTKTPKRALSKDDVMKIINSDSKTGSRRDFAKDIFTFSYLCGGISFVDIANLTLENIQEDRLIYHRQKTKGAINLKLSQQAILLIAKYESNRFYSGYLFPILHNKRHITPIQKNNRIHKICAQVNGELKLIARELEITTDVTTYVARHSFATVLKKSGVNIGIISEALGHQNIKTTAIYLNKFDNEQIDEAMSNLL